MGQLLFGNKIVISKSEKLVYLKLSPKSGSWRHEPTPGVECIQLHFFMISVGEDTNRGKPWFVSSRKPWFVSSRTTKPAT